MRKDDEVFMERVNDQLARARREHPGFVDVASNRPLNALINALEDYREAIGEELHTGHESAVTVLLCEAYEACVELAQGNWEAALDELAQVSAVTFRTAKFVRDIQACELPCGNKDCPWWDREFEQNCRGEYSASGEPLIASCKLYMPARENEETCQN